MKRKRRKNKTESRARIDRPTEKLYDADAYAVTFQATVLDCRQEKDVWVLILDRTLFFPEEGGQTPDRGTMAGRGQTGRVTDVQIDAAGVIAHTVTEAFAVGETVTGTIDWEHRFSNMQNHSGEHIFSGIVHAACGYANVGFHLSDHIMTMDYDGYMDEKQIAETEEAVNRAIAANAAVRCWYPDARELEQLDYRSKKEIEGPVRIVEVEGYDICACCAPHVSRTGEIGLFKVTGAEKYKGGVRIFALCGLRALEYVRKLERIAKGAAAALNAPVEEQAVGAAIQSLQDAIVCGRQRIAALGSRILESEIAGLDPDALHVLLFAKDLDVPIMRNALNGLKETHAGYCAIFCDKGQAADGTGVTEYSYLITSRSFDCMEAAKAFAEELGARGGGKPEMTQGSLKADPEEIKSVFAKLEQKKA